MTGITHRPGEATIVGDGRTIQNRVEVAIIPPHLLENFIINHYEVADFAIAYLHYQKSCINEVSWFVSKPVLYQDVIFFSFTTSRLAPVLQYLSGFEKHALICV